MYTLSELSNDGHVYAENRVLKVNFDNRMVENVTVEKRNTLLKERLME